MQKEKETLSKCWFVGLLQKKTEIIIISSESTIQK